MWSLLPPSSDDLRRFREAQSELVCSYPEVGHSRDRSPTGYDLDHNRILLGQGEPAFAAAVAALRRWEMFPRPWTRIEPESAPLVPGNVVVMLARVYGGYWVNACRIVYVVDETSPARRFGFAYGTLPGHVECGEERFLIEMNADGSVWYDLRAFSKPRHWLVRLTKPLARRLQRRFARESKRAMERAVQEALAG